jgi:AAA15 family ATPase/GTPase
MENNHLTYFKVDNFKKFESLEVNDIGQFNLIVGDNNVGKTCLLEALLFDNYSLKWISNLHQTLYLRGIHFEPKNINLKDIEFPKLSFFNYLVRDINKKLTVSFKTISDNKSLSIEYKNIKELKEDDFLKRNDNYNYENLEHWLKFFKNDVFEELQFMYQDNLESSLDLYWPFIAFNLSYSNDIEDFIRTLDKKRNEDEQKINDLSYNHKIELIQILNKIFGFKIVDYNRKSHGDFGMLSIATEAAQDYTPITQFGDGFNKIFRYVVEIMYVKERGDNRLMIDEIDTGIHYSKQKDFWINIIKICKELNVQLFATTHSKECLEAFVEASKEINSENDIRLIELKDYNSKIYSNTLKYESIIASLDSNVELRGGNIFNND